MEDIQAESLLKMDQPLQKVYERLDSKETEAILSMIKMHLELEGYLVMTATEGREALTQLSNAPDLICAYSTFECSGSYIIGYQYAGDEWD